MYSDFRCARMFSDLISIGEETGDWSKLTARVLVELRGAFPNVTIPEPVTVHGAIIEHAWHWAKGTHDDITNHAAMEWAAAPLGEAPVCLVGESQYSYYSGWIEGALRSSRRCLSGRIGGEVGARLQEIYSARDGIVPGDGSWGSDFAHIPPATSEAPKFQNERWWPYDVSDVGSCRKA